MPDVNDKTMAMNARLKARESSAHPRATNYTNVGVSQSIAYLDFDFIEPTLLAAIAKMATDRLAAPKGVDGRFFAHVAISVDVLARLQELIQQVWGDLREARQPKTKG